MNKRDVLARARAVFFEAILDGYVGDKKLSRKVSLEGGHKIITFPKGDFEVVDEYRVTPLSAHSGGTTTILHKKDPVWWMAYGGHYPKEAIPTLKLALRTAYEKREFFGGRGPEHLLSGKMLYINTFQGDFESFDGYEIIRSLATGTGDIIGCHRYFGMSLI